MNKRDLVKLPEGLPVPIDDGDVLAGARLQAAGEDATSSGRAMGTLDYMAPEQVRDSHSVDIRADIYSLGCTLYKLLTGEAPFSGSQYENTFDKMMAHLNDPVPPIRQARPDVPEKLAAGELARLLARRLDLAEGDGFFVEVDGARLPVGRRTLALVRKGAARLRQRPGMRNSLGPLKVVMPNPDDVYLHGTARPRLFDRNDRALSHGCIRVAEPAALAAFLLAGQPGSDRARIEAAMLRAEPLLVSLASPGTTKA